LLRIRKETLSFIFAEGHQQDKPTAERSNVATIVDSSHSRGARRTGSNPEPGRKTFVIPPTFFLGGVTVVIFAAGNTFYLCYFFDKLLMLALFILDKNTIFIFPFGWQKKYFLSFLFFATTTTTTTTTTRNSHP
jgi:hypothetical protein